MAEIETFAASVFLRTEYTNNALNVSDVSTGQFQSSGEIARYRQRAVWAAFAFVSAE
jgi:hypothetical protein